VPAEDLRLLKPTFLQGLTSSDHLRMLDSNELQAKDAPVTDSLSEQAHSTQCALILNCYADVYRKPDAPVDAPEDSPLLLDFDAPCNSVHDSNLHGIILVKSVPNI
jgi:hypothetical protein